MEEAWLIFILTLIGSAFIALIVRDRIIDWLKNKFSGVYSLFKGRYLLKEMEILGIKKIYKTRTEVENKNPFFRLDMSIELSHYKALGISLARIKNLGDEPIWHQLRKGCKFEFVLLNPDSPFMNQRSSQENPTLKGETEGFIEWIKKFSTVEHKTQIEVWIYDLMPTMAITIINDNSLFVNPYSLLRRNQEFPVIEIGDGSLFSLYTEEYQKVRGHLKTKQIL